jgi:tetratricopeptide (TPR) repeat protein
MDNSLRGPALRVIVLFVIVVAYKTVFGITSGKQKQQPDFSLTELNSLSKKYWDISLDSSFLYSRQAIAIAEQSRIKNDEVVKAYLYMAVSMYYQSKYDSAVKYALQGFSMADSIHSQWGLGFAGNLLCVLERRRANYDVAIEYGLKSAEISKQVKDTFNLAGVYQNLANIYTLTGKPVMAIDYLSKSLDLYLLTNDTTGLIMAHGNIGNLYLDMKDSEKGRAHILRALELDKYKELSYADNTLALGTIYLEFNKKYDTALQLFREAEAIYREIGIEDGIATANENIGAALLGLGKSEKAFRALKKAENQFLAIGDSSQIAFITFSFAKYYLKIDEPDTAQMLFKKALYLGRRSERLNIVNESLYQLYMLTKQQGNATAALDYYETYSQQEDSLEKALLSTRLINMEAKYQNIQKERKIELLTHEREKLKWREVQFFNIIFTMFALALVIGLWLYFKRKKEKQIVLQQQEILVQKSKLAEKELETKRIRQKEMEQEIEFKSKQLSTHALNMIQKNKVLQEVKSHLKEIAGKVKPEFRPNLKKIDLLLARNMKTEKEWNLFKMYFEQVNGDFFKKLVEINPSLNSNDLRHCALIKLNLNIKEVASLLNVSPHTVKSARYRLKRKLGISPDNSLGEYIRRI